MIYLKSYHDLMKRVLYKAVFLWVMLLLIAFGPLLFFLGFGVSDDLSFVGNIAPNFWDDLGYSLSRAGHVSRPIYGLIQTTTLHLFRDQFIFYNIFRLILWLAIIYQSRKVFCSYFGEVSQWILIFFVSFPIFSSAQLFNFFQMGYLLSILFYLVALRVIKDHEGGFTKEKYLPYLICSLLALFSCEIIFPLFIFPLVYNYLGKWRELLYSKLLRWSILIFISFFFYKFLIGPIYQSEAIIYGFDPSFNSVLQSLYYFVVLIVEIPMLLLEVLPFYLSEPALWLSLLVVPFIYEIRSNNNYKHNKRLAYSMLITMACCGLIFLASNYPAVSFGLYNKMMLPAQICYSVLIAMFCMRLLNTRLYLLAYVVSVLWFASMQMQTINSIRSWDQREQKLKEFVKFLNKEGLNDDFVFIEAQYFLPSNYNNEHVFALNDDFHGGLSYYGYLGNARRVYPFCLEMLRNRAYWSNHNIQSVINGGGVFEFKLIQSGKVLENNHNLKTLNSLSLMKNEECLRSRMRNYLIQKIKGL